MGQVPQRAFSVTTQSSRCLCPPALPSLLFRNRPRCLEKGPSPSSLIRPEIHPCPSNKAASVFLLPLLGEGVAQMRGVLVCPDPPARQFLGLSGLIVPACPEPSAQTGAPGL